MASEELIMHGAPDAAVARKVKAAITALFESDAFLFKADANERSVTHRLAVHLTPHFPNWHVDCEYNRDGFNPKLLQVLGNDGEPNGTNGSRVFPDVVIHQRGKSENLLVIEVKKSASALPDDADLAKLEALREQLGYKCALFLRFVCGAETPALEKAVWC